MEVKTAGSTGSLLSILSSLSVGEVRGILSVAVKCVDIGKNTGGESAALA